MPGQETNRRTGYREIAEQLRDDLRAGRLPAGEPLPSQAELVERYGVSRNTANAALQVLVAEGLIDLVPGKGFYPRKAERRRRDVARRVSRAAAGGGGPVGLSDVASEGGVGHMEVRGAGWVQPLPRVAALLAIEEGARVWERDRLVWSNDEPDHTATSWYPEDVIEQVPALMAPGADPKGRGVYEALAEAGRQFVEAETVSIARMPDPAERELLAIPPGVPLLEEWEVKWDDQGRPVEVVRSLLGGDRHELAYRYTVPSS
jgi:GntR family transcriptional regulator